VAVLFGSQGIKARSMDIEKSIVTACADDLRGTQREVYSWLEAKDLPQDLNEALEAAIGEYIERCSECDTWCEPSELVDEENEPCPCEGCRT